jgi:xanthine/uracil permease
MWMGLLITIAAVIGVPLRLAAKPPIKPQTLSRLTVLLLWSAGILSGLMTLIALAAAAWGMDTRVPWGLGLYMYLIPALSLPLSWYYVFQTLRHYRVCSGF